MDGALLGKVKEARENDFVLDRRLRRDLAVPFDEIHAVGDLIINGRGKTQPLQGMESVNLSVPAHQGKDEDTAQPSA